LSVGLYEITPNAKQVLNFKFSLETIRSNYYSNKKSLGNY